MEQSVHTIHLLLMEDESTTSVADFFKKENNVKIRLFDNLNDILDALNLSNDHSKSFMHFILLFNVKMVSEEIKKFILMVKEDPQLKLTPVFILSESGNNIDVLELYKSHLTNYILKPEDLDDLNRVLNSFMKFWFNSVKLP